MMTQIYHTVFCLLRERKTETENNVDVEVDHLKWRHAPVSQTLRLRSDLSWFRFSAQVMSLFLGIFIFICSSIHINLQA